MNEKLDIDVKTLRPFTKFIYTIGVLPTSYLMSMTYEEQLIWLCNYLTNTVIPTINNNAEAVKEVQDLVTQLQNYINNYFDNLDVQQEINNKLDEMAKDGTLTNLIKGYVDPIYKPFEDEINGKLNEQDVEIAYFKNTVNNTLSSMQSQINSVTSGSPAGVYATVSDLETANPDHSKIYLVTADGKWYYYNTTNTAWTEGGIYQASEDSTTVEENEKFIKTYIGQNYKNENDTNSINMFDKNNKYNALGYLTGVGISTSTSLYHSHPIKVIKGKTYKTKSIFNELGTNSKRAWYIDANGDPDTLVTMTLSGDNNEFATFTAPKNGYMIFNIGKTTDIENYMFCEELLYPQTYTPFKYEKNVTKIISPIGNINNITSDIANLDIINSNLSLTNLENVERNVNLFNKNSNLNVSDTRMSSTGYYEWAGIGYSHPILLYKGQKTYISRRASTFGNTDKSVYLLDNFKAFFNIPPQAESVEIPTYTTTVEDDYYMSFTPEVTGYYVFNYAMPYINDVQVIITDSIPVTYTNYKCVLHNVELDYVPTNNYDINPLFKKKISFTGDSICAGAGYEGGYAKIIGENNNMTVQNLGHSGAVIMPNIETSGGAYRYCIMSSIENMYDDYDYAIVEGGVNDSSLSLPLGSISEGYNVNFDTNTFYGAFENMLKTLITRFAGKKYGYIMVHQISANMRVVNNQSTSYYWACKKCCEKWGVPFLDLNVEVPPFAFLPPSGSGPLTALRDNYTKNGDGWHPNEDGYKYYYVPKIEAWLKTL